MPMSSKIHRSGDEESYADPAVTEVFDPEFKFIYEVPSGCVVHLPPPRLNITRLVLCRNYKAFDQMSCTMGHNCKFVHSDCDYNTLQAHPIHVNYIWRREELCTYARLPAGDVLEVLQPNGEEPAVVIPSNRILSTSGSVNASTMCRRSASMVSKDGDTDRPSHCAHYYFNRMCNRGERCNFIHAVYVDPNVQGDFKRTKTRWRMWPTGKEQQQPGKCAEGGGSGGGRLNDFPIAPSSLLLLQSGELRATRYGKGARKTVVGARLMSGRSQQDACAGPTTPPLCASSASASIPTGVPSNNTKNSNIIISNSNNTSSNNNNNTSGRGCVSTTVSTFDDAAGRSSNCHSSSVNNQAENSSNPLVSNGCGIQGGGGGGLGCSAGGGPSSHPLIQFISADNLDDDGDGILFSSFRSAEGVHFNISSSNNNTAIEFNNSSIHNRQRYQSSRARSMPHALASSSLTKNNNNNNNSASHAAYFLHPSSLLSPAGCEVTVCSGGRHNHHHHNHQSQTKPYAATANRNHSTSSSYFHTEDVEQHKQQQYLMQQQQQPSDANNNSATAFGGSTSVQGSAGSRTFRHDPYSPWSSITK